MEKEISIPSQIQSIIDKSLAVMEIEIEKKIDSKHEITPTQIYGYFMRSLAVYLSTKPIDSSEITMRLYMNVFDETYWEIKDKVNKEKK